MKLTRPCLALALSFVVVGPAQAAIDLSSSITGQPTSEMVFVAYDPVNLVTYTRDLGTTIPWFNYGSNHQVSTLNGFDGFLSAADPALSRWAILASDAVVPIGTFHTVANGASGVNPNGPRVSAINSAMNTLFNAHNSASTLSNAVATGTHEFEEDGWSLVIGGPSYAQGSQLFTSGHNFGGQLVASAGLDQTMSLYAFTFPTVRGSTRTLLEGWAWVDPNHPDSTYYNGRFYVSGNTLMYIDPVPEPGTYALMLAGLFTLGAVARRRRA